MTTIDFELTQNAFGRLVLSRSNGECHEGVVPVRAFPLSAPEEGIALVDEQGQELVWIDRLSDCPDALQRLITEELESRELMPEIQKITHVSPFSFPCTWNVDTDRGVTCFVLEDEGDIRRIHLNTILVNDSHGVPFIIRNVNTLDKHSRQLLERFV